MCGIRCADAFGNLGWQAHDCIQGEGEKFCRVHNKPTLHQLDGAKDKYFTKSDGEASATPEQLNQFMQFVDNSPGNKDRDTEDNDCR